MHIADRQARLVAAIATVLVHTALVAFLARPASAMRTAAGTQVPNDALQVVFVPRRTPRLDTASSQAREATASRLTPRRPPRDPPVRVDAATTAVAPASTAAPAAPPALVMELPAPPHAPPGAGEARRWLDRRAPLDPATTRFERTWVPAGDAITQARHRSVAANIALGLFGGPPRRCGEVERRLRRPDCLALHGDEADSEALRRSLDRP